MYSWRIYPELFQFVISPCFLIKDINDYVAVIYQYPARVIQTLLTKGIDLVL
jgi:hypothetical protein